MTTWAEFNKKLTQQTTSKSWSDFNTQTSQRAYSQEASSQKEIDPVLFQQLKSRGLQSTTINDQLEPKKESYLKTLGQTTKETFGGLFDQMFRSVRASTQVIATPIAGALALVPGGATPSQAMKESLTMAKDVLLNKNVSIDKGVEDAAQMWLKNRGVGKYGGKDPDIADVAALSILGFANLFGDPAFELGALKPAYGALKEFATFKKVGQVEKGLAEGTKLVKGTGIAREFELTPDLKIKVKPQEKSIVIEGYKRRFPTQKALPDNQMAKETQDLVVNTREATGMELQAEFRGDDLIMTPTTPIVKTTQPVVKIEYPLMYNSAEEFVKAQGTPEFYRETSFDRLVEDIGGRGKFEPRYYSEKLDTAIGQVGNENVIVKLGNKPDFVERVKGIKGDIGGEVQITNPNYKNDIEYLLIKKDTLLNKERDGQRLRLFLRNNNFELPKSKTDLIIEKVRGNEYVKINNNNFKTKSQLTDILNKAQEKVEIQNVEPEIKKSTLGLRIKQEAIEKELIKQARNLPGYETMNMAEQSQMASNLINNDFEQAKRIVLGDELPPTGLRIGSLWTAMKKYAFDKGDIDLIRQLSKSKVASQASALGQEVKAFDEQNINDPVKIIRELNEIKAKKVTKQAKTVEERKIEAEIRAVRKSEKELEDFINSIEC